MAEENKVIKDTIEALEEINADEEKARIIELRQKYIWDKKAELETAEDRGKTEKAKEIAKKMKTEGIDIELIIKVTELTKEEIEKL